MEGNQGRRNPWDTNSSVSDGVQNIVNIYAEVPQEDRIHNVQVKVLEYTVVKFSLKDVKWMIQRKKLCYTCRIRYLDTSDHFSLTNSTTLM